MIEVKDLSRIFESGSVKTVALDNISLKISDGEFVSIIGPSGAGKSTLLYQMSLLDHPSAGSIWIKNQEVTHLASEERTKFRLDNLGYIFQDYALLPELTSLENVMVPLLMRGVATEKAERIAWEVLDKMGLEKRVRNLPSQMSGGEQQRVSIARSIAHEPAIVFADEPTANLDSRTSGSIMETFKDLHRHGQTIVMVTHEMEYAELAERIIEMRDGRIMNDRKTGKN